MPHVLLPLALLAAVPAAPAPKGGEAPKGPPPEIRIVKMNDKGDLVSEITVMTSRVEIVERTVEELVNGMKVQRKVAQAVPVMVHERRQVVYPSKGVKAFTADGKAVALRDLAKRLAGPTPVVVSADDRPVDPAYLRLFNKDALVFVLPAPKEMPRGKAPAPPAKLPKEE
jgi:hypothetical protein